MNLVLLIRFLILPFGFLPLEMLPLLIVIPPWSLEFAGSKDCSCNTQDMGFLPTALLDAVEGFNTLFCHPKGTDRLDNWYHCLSLLNH